METKKLEIPKGLLDKMNLEITRLKTTEQDYIQACLQFFLLRKIDPRIYQTTTSQQVVDLLQEAVHQIFDYLVFQEKHILKDLLLESVKTRILTEITIHNGLSLREHTEEEIAQIKRENDAFYKERLQHWNNVIEKKLTVERKTNDSTFAK